MIRYSLIALSLSSLISTTPAFSQDLWSVSTVNNSFNSTWNSVAYGNGTYVAVNGWGRIVTSTDGGATFDEVANYQSAGVNFNDVEYGSNGTSDVFWATGNFGSSHFIYESSDGVTWTEITGNFSFFASQGGNEIAVGTSDELIYTRNAPGDVFLYDGTYYSFGLGPEPDIYTSTDGESFTQAVSNYSEWVTGGIVIDGQVLPYGVVFETPGDFSTRRGAIFGFTNNPLAAMNPAIIATGANTYISDMDADLSSSTTFYATAADAFLTSIDSGVSWTVDSLDTEAFPSDMSEMAVGPDGRVAVGASGIFYFGSGSIDPDTWGVFDLVDGQWIDTGDWLGWLSLVDPSGGGTWAYSLSNDTFFYISKEIESSDNGIWMYAIR